AKLEEAIHAAVALELFHNAFLVHDDIEDESDARRGMPTLHALHGVPVAINVGDALTLLGVRALVDARDVLVVAHGELGAAVGSLLSQRGVEVDVVVVGNGWEPTGLPEGVKTLALEENLGFAGAAVHGLRAADGEWVFFLNNDATVDEDTLSELMAAAEAGGADVGA
ncbi:MAG: polyprenyl synthetase family protein, partial [Thermoplasmatota archaeon]